MKLFALVFASLLALGTAAHAADGDATAWRRRATSCA
jgi:hypothetical protein